MVVLWCFDWTVLIPQFKCIKIDSTIYSNCSYWYGITWSVLYISSIITANHTHTIGNNRINFCIECIFVVVVVVPFQAGTSVFEEKTAIEYKVINGWGKKFYNIFYAHYKINNKTFWKLIEPTIAVLLV